MDDIQPSNAVLNQAQMQLQESWPQVKLQYTQWKGNLMQLPETRYWALTIWSNRKVVPKKEKHG